MTSTHQFHVASPWQPIMRELGIDAETIFTHPQVRVWRKLADRENATLDAGTGDDRRRLHVKRYMPTSRDRTPASDELRGHELLVHHGIPTANLVGWGEVGNGRSFVLFEDLAGFTPADKWLEAGGSFSTVLRATADLVAKLHHDGLHHRDLYLCHFMIKADRAGLDVRLIDTARVRKLPGFLTRGRWIVKDLSQFWYSTLKLAITEAQRDEWLLRYCQQRQLPGSMLISQKIERKVKRIARHDARLNELEPTRNVSIPW